MKNREASRTPQGSLWEASKFVLIPLCHFVQSILPWVRELVPSFTISSAKLQIQTSLNDLKTGVDKTWGRPCCRPWPTLWPTLWPTGGQISF